MEKIERAYFQAKGNEGTRVQVHFNPASLQYQISNTLASEGRGEGATQYVSQSTGKLTMDLVFDTTGKGEDVRTYTGKLAQLMKPVPGRNAHNVPAKVEFVWGSYRFEGVVESYKETFDFFAATGIPLRAGVNLTLASQELVFEESAGKAVDTQGKGLQPDAVVVPTSTAPAASPSAVAAAAGNPRAARLLAAANGQESLRFSASASLSVQGGVSLRGPVAFSAGAGAGLELGAGISAGAGGEFGFGASASAGVSASAGAFAGLRAAAQGSARLDTSRLLQGSATAALGTDRGALFAPGGRAQLGGAASLRADVGAGASLSTRVRFEG